MELPKDIKNEIWDYCRLNDISSVDDFIIKMVKQGFTSEKFGATPWDKPAEIKEVEKIVEVEKEVIKEVPVEVIKEVEKVVEKEVFVTDDEANNKLKEYIDELENNVSLLKEELDASEDEINALLKTNQESNDNIITLNQKITDLSDKIKQLEEELEIEKAKPKQEDDDIYGERKGFLGSNLSDLWKKKKQ